MAALLTDLYQLTMAAGYWHAGKTEEIATFELFVRRLPPQRDYLVVAGLAQAIEYLQGLQFTPAEVEYVRGLPQFARLAPKFFDFLLGLRFTGDVDAMPEGSIAYAGEPLLTVRAPLVVAQLVETYLLATVGFQTLIATKAARIVQAAQGRPVVEMGARRAQSPEAGVLAARACYLAGCAGTSNTEAGLRYGVPVYGTCAHSWVMSFPAEEESQAELQQVLGPYTTYLLDTYDTLTAARKAVELGRPVAGVRLDSGDFRALSREVREILSAGGLADAKIMVTGDLNEERIAELLADGAPIDSFGVGTELVTSADAPALSAVYKLVEIETSAGRRETVKFSGDKATLPGRKQVYRQPTQDVLAGIGETTSGQPLLEPVLRQGALVSSLPSLEQSREFCRIAVSSAGKRPVVPSSDLLARQAALRESLLS